MLGAGVEQSSTVSPHDGPTPCSVAAGEQSSVSLDMNGIMETIVNLIDIVKSKYPDIVPMNAMPHRDIIPWRSNHAGD